MTTLNEAWALQNGDSPPEGWSPININLNDPATGFEARAYKATDGRVALVLNAADPTNQKDSKRFTMHSTEVIRHSTIPR